MRNANRGSISGKQFGFALSWFPNSSLGNQASDETPFCFPFVLPVISDETEFQEAKHSQIEFGNERKSAGGLAHSKTLRELGSRFERAPAFGARSRHCGTAFPSREEVGNGIKTFTRMKGHCK